MRMSAKSNIHTHCTHCDGKNTIDKMVQTAIELGLESIGFSSHAPTGFRFDTCQIRDLDGYFLDLDTAKQKYRGKIEIFKGLELEAHVAGPNGDTFPQIDPRCDFTIGSSHYVCVGGRHMAIDDTPAQLLQACNTLGPEGLLCTYFDDVLRFANAVPFPIIGHIDLFTKFNSRLHIWDESSAIYQSLVISYIDRLIPLDRIFEVNTGAINKGYRSVPYPAPFILRHLQQKRARIILTSDAHSATTLCGAFDPTIALLKSLGFTEQMQLVAPNKFVPVPL